MLLDDVCGLAALWLPAGIAAAAAAPAAAFPAAHHALIAGALLATAAAAAAACWLSASAFWPSWQPHEQLPFLLQPAAPQWLSDGRPVPAPLTHVTVCQQAVTMTQAMSILTRQECMS